jgi:hypothetical protein
MVGWVSQASDRERLNLYADELEKRAEQLGQGAAAPRAPELPVTHEQQQVQQQQETQPTTDVPEKSTP